MRPNKRADERHSQEWEAHKEGYGQPYPANIHECVVDPGGRVQQEGMVGRTNAEGEGGFVRCYRWQYTPEMRYKHNGLRVSSE